MADSLFGQNVLGSAYLPASPLYPVQDLTAPNPSAAQPGQGAAPPPDPSAGVPAPAAAAGGMPPWVAGLLPSQPGGVFGPNTGRVMSALGAGLSSAGQNWNKPALAALASGAGAALQGAQQFDNQAQDAKLKALHAAIAAFKAGDIAAYHRSLADYHKTLAEEKRYARPAPPPPAPPESQLPAAAAVAPAQAVAQAAPPAQPNGASAEGATVQPQVTVAHVRALDRLLTDAGVPPDRVETADLDSAAQLMAAKQMPALEAFEAASLHNAIEAGHVSPAEVNLIYGPGAADAVHSTATS
jgi:hypothetical protein